MSVYPLSQHIDRAGGQGLPKARIVAELPPLHATLVTVIEVDGRFICPDCSRSFSSKTGLRNHHARNHIGLIAPGDAGDQLDLQRQTIDPRGHNCADRPTAQIQPARRPLFNSDEPLCVNCLRAICYLLCCPLVVIWKTAEACCTAIGKLCTDGCDACDKCLDDLDVIMGKCCKIFNEKLLDPIRKSLDALCTPIRQCISKVGKLLWRCLCEVFEAIVWCFESMFDAVVYVVLRPIYQYILMPFNQYVVQPLCQCVSCCCQVLWKSAKGGCQALWKCIGAVFGTIWRGLSALGSFVHNTILRPLNRCLYSCIWWPISQCLSSISLFIYRKVLLPVYNSIAAVTGAVYSNVLTPTGHAIGHLLKVVGDIAAVLLSAMKTRTPRQASDHTGRL
jgi:hypothetical protein